MSNPIDLYAGLGDHRDVEQKKFSLQLLEQVKAKRGLAKVSRWTYNGQTQYYVQEIVDRGTGYHVRSGPNPPMGYHTAAREYAIYDYSLDTPLLTHKQLIEYGFES